MFTNWLTAVPSSINTPPPDVIIEVGPPPCTRFSAHSSLLSAHSGYLRAAIRTEDVQNTYGISTSLENPVFIPNVTSEQFAPLLTYMYTGFLNLSIENIFGVLLATHVLHMPQALELCREFLTRTQSQRPYMQGETIPSSFEYNSNIQETCGISLIKPGTLKIVRPIASKATNSCLGFITPPSTNVLLPSPATPFKSLILSKPNLIPIEKVSERSRSPIASTSKEPPTDINKTTNKEQINPKSISSSSSIVSEPIDSTINNIGVNVNNKIIVDVASCDGPVRFRRVLNDAYGLIDNNNQKYSNDNVKNVLNSNSNERSQHTISKTFHQQMARNILQQSNHIPSDESENSEDINPNLQKSDEIFTCIYCKHTFKSQYCYIKHAKRHLNPLRTNSNIMEPHDSSESDDKEDKIMISNRKTKNITSSRTSSLCNVPANIITNTSIKREVRPLDMNVQYYPCKTCGCKFPSYYFVHKHRKLCHANEDNDSTINNTPMEYLNQEKTK